MTINAVIFDAYGTLIDYRERRSPFRVLMRWAKQTHGHVPSVLNKQNILGQNLDIRELCQWCELAPPESLLQSMEADLAAEIQAMALYNDVVPCLENLRERSIKIALCSNLSQPYGAVIERLLLNAFDATIYSYEASCHKPDDAIYQARLNTLQLPAEQCLFVGDTYLADYQGPNAAGMLGVHLLRSGRSDATRQVSTLVDIGQWL